LSDEVNIGINIAAIRPTKNNPIVTFSKIKPLLFKL